MPDEKEGLQSWERYDGVSFTIEALRGHSRPGVYIAQDDPYGGVTLVTVAEMDDLIWRLVQAREWLKDQLSDQETH